MTDKCDECHDVEPGAWIRIEDGRCIKCNRIIGGDDEPNPMIKAFVDRVNKIKERS